MKACRTCGTDYPLTEVYWEKDFDLSWRPVCRACRGKPSRVNAAGEWHCTRCDAWFPREQYTINAATGRPRSYCKPCDKARNRKAVPA